MNNILIFQDMEGMPPNLLMDLYFNAPAEVDLEFKKKRGGVHFQKISEVCISHSPFKSSTAQFKKNTSQVKQKTE